MSEGQMEQAKHMLRRLFQDCLAVDFTDKEALTLKELPACKGVLLFADGQDNPIQLLIAGDIRRIARARLQQPADEEPAKRRTNIAEITAKVYYRCCYNNFRTTLEHYRIAKALYPADYTNHFVFAAANFVTINTEAKWPFFKLKNKLTQSWDIGGGIGIGPFPSRKSAADFIQNIEQAFGLCRRAKILASDGIQSRCPYLQIGGCSGPCVGKVSRAEYLDRIEKAVAAVGPKREGQIAELEKEMVRLAGQMEFEKAQSVKKQIDHLTALGKSAYKWTNPLSNLKIVHIDKSAKIAVEKQRRKEQVYSAFVIRAGVITELADFTIDQIDDVCRSIKDQLALPVKTIEPNQLAEQLAIVAYFLYRNNPAGLWLNLSAGKILPEPEEIKELITA
jgi:excinuclease UvrABC nuclease subunit